MTDLCEETVERVCARCKTSKPLALFAKDRRHPLGHAYACRECETIRKKKYFAGPVGKQKRALWARDEYWSNREKHQERRKQYARKGESTPAEAVKDRARRLVAAAIRAGKLDKPTQCQDCGGSGPIHGHHGDYNLPLAVDWLCAVCHGLRHRKHPSLTQEHRHDAG